MDFILRIFFIGLVAFVPDQGGQGMTVLLVDARHGYVASDGEQIPPHFPLLFARADRCSGDCGAQEGRLADIVYPDALSAGERIESLRGALQGGGGWLLDGSELRILLPDTPQSPAPPFRIVGAGGASIGGTGLPLPSGSAPPDDFDYVADLAELTGGGLVVDPALLQGPEEGRTVAYLRLAAGMVTASRLSGFADEVVEFRFATAAQLSRGLDLSMPSAALADRVMVEIPMRGNSVRLEERTRGGAVVRRMDLAPNPAAVVEVAIVNLPRHSFQFEEEPDEQRKSAEELLIDRHFELYYELAQCVPARNHRPVPGYWNGRRDPRPPGSKEAASPLLSALGLAPGRGVWSQPTCVVSQIPGG